MRVFKARLAVYANRLHLIRFLKESEKSAAGGRSLSQPESKVLRFFPKINQSFITQRRIHISKFYKVLLVVSLFLTVIATSAITTVIISPSSAQASSYFADDVQRDVKRLRTRVSALEMEVLDLHDRVRALE